MPSRPYWKGHIRLALVSIPVEIYTATRSGASVTFRQIHEPSLNPADKRLAARTEDHPLSYGVFEAIIPQSQYGGGTAMLWDRSR